MTKTGFIVALIATTLNIQAQILSDAQLSDANKSNMAAFEQMKRNSDSAFTQGIQTFAIVGTSLSCLSYGNNFGTIQAAIDAGFEEIRITTETYEENVVIDDIDVQLLGGYASCGNAFNGVYDSDSLTTTIKPATGSGQPAILIRSNSRKYVTLRNLTAKNGEFTDPLKAGGLSLYYADVGLTLNTVTLAQNTSQMGGGMLIYNGSSDVKAYNLLVANNTADYGGGIYCSGDNNILIDGEEDAAGYGIVLNKAINGGGGGAYISGNCKLVSYVGAGEGFDFRGFLNNQASGSGGAIFARSGAQVFLNGNRYCSYLPPYTCYGHNSTPVNLSGNTADYGGALYAVDANTAIYGKNLKVNANTAKNGAAVYLINGATFQTQSTYDNGAAGQASHCWSKGKCNQFVENNTTDNTANNQTGSIFYVNKSQLKVTHSHIEDNQAYWGSVLYAYGDNSTIDLESSYVTGNEFVRTEYIRAPIQIESDASARIVHSTIADNYTNATPASIYNSLANLQVYSSIVHNNTTAKSVQETNSVSHETDCLIVNNLDGINDSTSMVADPEFIDRNNNNYHIDASLSPAVDYCHNTLAQITGRDTDRDARGWDDYTVTNVYGPYDAGADETYGNDIIFADGFE